MKLLLDECLPHKFRNHFPSHEVHTATWAGFGGLKNGALLKAAENAGYDVLISVDKGIPHQNDWQRRRVALINVRARSNDLCDLIPFVGAIAIALERIRPGEVVEIP